jgi:ankyrin repeat protein
MGASFANYQVRTADTAACLKAVAGLVHLRALVTNARKGWITVYDEKSEAQDADELRRVAKGLSTRLATDVFAFMLHDSDVFIYILYQKGKLIDQFNSQPDYFGSVPAAERKKWAGDFKKLLRLAPKGTSLPKIQKALGKSPLFHDHVVTAFASVMGMDAERAGTGFKYVQESSHSFELVHGRGRSPNDAALSDAVQRGELAVVLDLLKKGTSPNGRDRYGMSLLVSALMSRKEEIASALLDAGADPFLPANGDAIWAAAAHGHRNILARLLREPSEKLKASASVALPSAVLAGRPEIAKDLLDAGANPNMASESGQTPLMTACFRGPEVMMEILSQRKDRTFPGHQKNDWKGMAQALIAAGANVNAQDKNGITALMLAKVTCEQETVAMLLDAGADPNLKPTGETFAKLARILGAQGVGDQPPHSTGAISSDQAPAKPTTSALGDVHLNPKVREALLQHLRKNRSGKKKR